MIAMIACHLKSRRSKRLSRNGIKTKNDNEKAKYVDVDFINDVIFL